MKEMNALDNDYATKMKLMDEAKRACESLAESERNEES